MNKIILDTDPGVDDALALMLLAKSQMFEILAITTVAGNSTIENTTANAQFLKNLLALDCPIYSGAEKALIGPFTTAHVHGVSGLAGIKHQEVPKLTNSATNNIVELIKQYPHEVTIICIGPETNLAKAILANPELPPLIKQVIIMGGAILSPGNMTATAEFNIALDPEAAEIIFEASVSKVLVPLDVCYQTPLFKNDFEKLKGSSLYETVKAITTPYIKAMNRFENQQGAIVYDALAAYFLINPAAFSVENLEVHIETKGKYTRGATVADRRLWGDKKPNTLITTGLDRDKFIEDFSRILTS